MILGGPYAGAFRLTFHSVSNLSFSSPSFQGLSSVSRCLCESVHPLLLLLSPTISPSTHLPKQSLCVVQQINFNGSFPVHQRTQVTVGIVGNGGDFQSFALICLQFLPFLILNQARSLWHASGLFLVVSLPWLYWLTVMLHLLRMQTNLTAEISMNPFSLF